MFRTNFFKTLGVIALAMVLAFSLAACRGGKSTYVAPALPGGGGGGTGPPSGDDPSTRNGSGTKDDPFLISGPADLEDLAERLENGDEPDGQYYKLIDDIDLSDFGPGYNGGKGWKSIGDRNNPFKGHLDGDGHTISNLFIDDDTRDDAGLFGVIEDGTVENIGIVDADVTGGDNVGGIVGHLIDSDISDCYVTGEINGNDNVGGIAGLATDGSNISNSFVESDVHGRDNVGGVVGLITDSTVRDCYVSGDVDGNNNIGGVVGNVSENSSVTNCYTTGEVSGDNAVGGIAGNVADTSTVEGCVALNPTIRRNSGASTNFGRVAGRIAGTPLVNNAAYDDMILPGDVTVVSDANGVHGLSITDAESKTQGAYTGRGWGFGGNASSPWQWGGASYPLPVLYWQLGGHMPSTLPDHLEPGGAVFSLEATPAGLSQGVATSVTFTFKRGGQPAPGGTSVTFAANSNFQNLPGSVTTNGSGQVTVSNLTAVSSGSQTIQATVNVNGGKPVSVSMGVTAGTYTLEASTTSLTQGVAASVTFTFKQGGIAVASGTSVTFTTNTNFNNLPGSVTTNASGQVTVSNLTAVASGSQTVQATIGGQTVSVSFTVAAGTYSLEASETSLTQELPTSVTFTFKQGGFAVAGGASVTFTANSNFLNLPASATTNASGQVTVSNLMAIGAAGTQTIQATVSGQPVSASLSIAAGTFTMEAPATLSFGAATSTAFTFKVNGQILPGASVTFTSNTNFNNLPSAAQTTNASGQVTVTNLTAITMGSQTVAATINGRRSVSVAINVTAGTGTYSLEASPTSLTQGTAASVVFTFKLNGVALPGTSVTFTSNTNFQNLPTVAQTTNASGQVTVSNLTAVTSGSQSVSATVNSQPVSVTFTVAAGAYSLEASPTSLTQGTAASVTFTFKQGGFAVASGTSVTFTSSTNFQNLPTVAQTTNASGQVTVSNLVAVNSGTQTVQVTIGGQTVSVTFTVAAGAYSLEASPTSLTQGTAASVTFTFKQGGFAVASGTSVTFTSSTNFQNLPTVAQTTNASGQVTVSNLTAVTSGSQTVQATIGGQTVSVSFTVAAGAYTLEASATSLTQELPTSVTFTFKQGGFALPSGASVTFTTNSNFSNLPTAAQTTNASGEVTVSNLMAIGAAGAQTIQATVNSQSVSVNITIAAGTFTMEATPASLSFGVAASTAFTFKVNSQVLPGASVTFTSNTNFNNLPAAAQTTNASGQVTAATLTGVSLGSQTVGATINGRRSVSVSINVAPPAGATYSLEASPTSLEQGTATSVTFTFKLNGLVLGNTSVTFTSNTNFSNLPTAARTTNASGQTTISNLTVVSSGSQTVQATVNGQTVSVSFTVTTPHGLTESDPIVISSGLFLKELADRVNAGTEPGGLYYKLAENVDLSVYGASYNGGRGWTPIGSESRPFTGHFDGDGKIVMNLFINIREIGLGLFGYINGATVKNLGVLNASISSGEEYVGGVAGYVSNGSIISNCYTTGNVSGRNNSGSIGGVAGYVSDGSSINNSYAMGNVSGGIYVGGVAGYIRNGSSVSNCFATGNVGGSVGSGSIGSESVGGVVGAVDGGNISNCFATGNISGNFLVGGVAGEVYYGNIRNCYATGEVFGILHVGGVSGYIRYGSITGSAALNPAIVRTSGTAAEFGRVVGEVGVSSTVINNMAYDGMTVLGVSVSGGAANNKDGANLTKADAKLQTTYTGLGWAFGTTDDSPWKWGGASYPLPVPYWQDGAPGFPAHLN